MKLFELKSLIREAVIKIINESDEEITYTKDGKTHRIKRSSALAYSKDHPAYKAVIRLDKFKKKVAKDAGKQGKVLTAKYFKGMSNQKSKVDDKLKSLSIDELGELYVHYGLKDDGEFKRGKEAVIQKLKLKVSPDALDKDLP